MIGRVGVNAIDPIAILVKAIERPLFLHVEEREDGKGDANGEPTDVNQCVESISYQTSDCDCQVVFTITNPLHLQVVVIVP